MLYTEKPIYTTALQNGTGTDTEQKDIWNDG